MAIKTPWATAIVRTTEDLGKKSGLEEMVTIAAVPRKGFPFSPSIGKTENEFLYPWRATS